jgi:adenylyltransferase/sulfurtransferase
MKSITPTELKAWMDEQKQFILIDVLENFERDIFNIGGLHIPLNDVLERRNEFDHEIPVIVYCEKGIRSGIVVQRLEAFGFTNLYNLSGGMSGWKRSVD